MTATDATAIDLPEVVSAHKLKVALVGSSGGHLAQLKALSPWWENHDRFWVTFDLPGGMGELGNDRRYHAYYPTTRSLRGLIRNFGVAVRCLRRERPDVIVSCGAGVAIPFFVIAKMMRIPTVYFEVYDRIDSPSLTGRVCYRLATVFLLQWEDQRRFYPKGVVIGPLV